MLVVVFSIGITMPVMILPNEIFMGPMQWATACVISLIMVFIVTVNTLSYDRLRKRKAKSKKIPQTKRDNSNQEFNEGMIKSDKRKSEAVKTLMIITFFYVVCSLPNIINMCINASYDDVADKNLFYVIWMTNSGINAVIYLLRTKELRQYYVHAVWPQ